MRRRSQQRHQASREHDERADTVAPGATSIDAGRLGRLDVRGKEIILGAPLLMTKANIGQYDF